MYVLATSLTLAIHMQEFMQLESNFEIWEFILAHQEAATAGFVLSI